MSHSGKRHAKYLDGKQKLYWDFVEVDKYIYIYIYISNPTLQNQFR